jgi:hypothetical protein
VVGLGILPCDLNIVAGGNQRELARQKNQKKQQEQEKRKGSSDKDSNKGLTLEQRKQRHVSGRKPGQYKLEWCRAKMNCDPGIHVLVEIFR